MNSDPKTRVLPNVYCLWADGRVTNEVPRADEDLMSMFQRLVGGLFHQMPLDYSVESEEERGSIDVFVNEEYLTNLPRNLFFPEIYGNVLVSKCVGDEDVPITYDELMQWWKGVIPDVEMPAIAK